MIEFKSKKEKEIVYYYANLMGNDDVLESLSKRKNINEKDVRVIARFCWNMVDVSITEKSKNAKKFENVVKTNLYVVSYVF